MAWLGLALLLLVRFFCRALVTPARKFSFVVAPVATFLGFCKVLAALIHLLFVYS